MPAEIREAEQKEVGDVDRFHHLRDSRLTEHHVLDHLVDRDAALFGGILELGGHQRRLHVAGAERERPDLPLALGGDRLGQSLQAELRDVVRDLVARDVMTVDRRHVADTPLAVVGLSEVWETQFREIQRGPEHDSMHQVVGLHRELVDGVDVLHPGDVREVLEIAQLCGLVDDPLDVVVDREIAGHRLDLALETEVLAASHRPVEAVFVDVGRRDREAVTGGGQCGRSADTGGSASHETDVAVGKRIIGEPVDLVVVDRRCRDFRLGHVFRLPLTADGHKSIRGRGSLAARAGERLLPFYGVRRSMSTRAGTDEGAFWGDATDDVALERYRTLVNTIDDAIYQLDTDGRFVAVNDVIVEATGYAREDLLGEHVSLVLADDDVARVEREITTRIVANDDEIATFELAVRTADGDAIPFELRVNLLLEDGEFRGTIGVARDRSEKRRRQDTLASAIASYESITSVIDGADIGAIVLNEQCEIEWADESVEEYFGLDRASLIGRDTRTVVDEVLKHRVDDPDSFAATVLSSYDDERYVDGFECRITGDDDREGRWLSYQSKPIESGEFAGGRVEFYYDITDQKESKGALRESEAAFRSLVDAVEEYAIFRLDTDGHVVSWNEGARQIKGYERAEILSEHFSQFYTDADRAAGVPARNLERALENGSVEDEGWRVRADGTRFWANVTITSVRDDDGTHRGYLKVTRDMTDRWERERELESELQRILGRISDAFYAVDDEFRFTHVNDRAAELLERSEEELLGERLWDVFPDLNEIDEVWDAFHTALESQEPTSYELYYDTLDFRVEANLYPSETGISVYFRDVTERRERERELERTERRFEAIFEDPNILVGLLEPDGTVIDVNGTAMEYVDAELTDVIGEQFCETPWWGGESADVREDVREWTERAAAGEYVNFEADLSRPDGERYTLNGVFRPVTNDDGDVVSIVVSDRDITERKKRERELEESEQRYRTLAENFPNGVVTLFDHDLEYTLAAGQGFEKIPVDPADIEGNHYRDAWDAATSDALEPALRGALEGEQGAVELEYADREWVVYTVPITDTRGDVFAGVTMAHDITERKEYQRRLEETVDRLEESNKRLEQFAYAASHDLQEPLRMVSSYLQLIEGRYANALDSDGREFLEYAVDGAERMRDMIDGLLAYSRVETQGEPLEPVALETVFDDVLEDLQLRLEETDAALEVGELPRVEGDASQLRQVFQNLLSNALEYSGDEPPRVRVDAERRGEDWVVSVHDEGIGIDPDDQDRIFEVFERLHGREAHAGTGIGLALCQRIVERHGGEIRVDSVPGEGATFSVVLPAADAE